MSFKLALFAALASVARAGYINGGHAVGQPIGGSYVSNVGLLRSGGSSYGSSYGSYGESGFPVGSGRGFSSGVTGPVVSVRPGSYGSGYSNYGSRNSQGGVSGYSGIPGYGSRALPYPQPTFASSPILRNQAYQGFSGFNAVYSTPYPATLNYGHQPIAYSTPIPHQSHGSFNGLGNGYGY